MPFCASGRMSEKAKAAALPELVSSQMPVLSITVTSWPASASLAAQDMPTMPAPTISMADFIELAWVVTTAENWLLDSGVKPKKLLPAGHSTA